MARRMSVAKGRSARKFKKRHSKTHGLNMMAVPRGGYRL